MSKKLSKLLLGYKIHSIIEREYVLIRRFKTKTASLNDSYGGLSEKNEVVYRDRGCFGVKSKAYDAAMK